MFNRLKDERGFTLIELLVVVLIIGILAAVALPTFLGQRDKGYNADAKSNAKNVQTLVESCGVDNGGDYTSCTDSALEADNGGLPFGSGAGKVTVSGQGPDGYTITATSKAKSNPTFVIVKSDTGVTHAGSTGTW
jgi:type IV pilus assembly protein PilA